MDKGNEIQHQDEEVSTLLGKQISSVFKQLSGKKVKSSGLAITNSIFDRDVSHSAFKFEFETTADPVTPSSPLLFPPPAAPPLNPQESIATFKFESNLQSNATCLPGQDEFTNEGELDFGLNFLNELYDSVAETRDTVFQDLLPHGMDMATRIGSMRKR